MSRQENRHPSLGQIDRDTVIKFTFDGHNYEGFAGDTLASALLANGVRIFGRSFKYHRPRGVLSAGSEEPNALVEIHEGDQVTPNCRAPMVEIYDAMVATSQNRWPSLRFDLMSVNNLFSRFLSAGFYYKTFFWPNWKYFEGAIRRSAGLGRAGLNADNSYYERQSLHCDRLVVGAGRSGVRAAIAAATAGEDVVLVDENADFTGRLSGLENIRVLTRTTASAYYDHNMVACVERVTDHLADKGDLPRERLWRIRAGHVVLATGALEQPMIFNNNDRPGIMLSRAVRRYLQQYGVVAGQQVVIFTDNDDAYETAAALEEAGATVKTIIDARAARPTVANSWVNKADILINHAVVDTKGGFNGLRSVIVQDLSSGATREVIACDLLAVSGGFAPALHLFSQSGGKIVWDDARACFMAGESKQPLTIVGQAAAAAERQKLWQMPDPGGVKASKKFVDQQSDVTTDDITLAHHEGFVSVEHLKRYTALGMGTEQGKTANLSGHALMAEKRGSTMNAVGTTTFRPPYVPVTLGAYGGRSVRDHLTALRQTPMDQWNTERGCGWIDAGHWRRARHYPKTSETIETASWRETRATRSAVGVCDVSTLGKIEVKGPDAAEFLNRVYTNGFTKLPVGKARYGLMLREDGILFDDGTTSRLGDDHYFMTTTSGGHGHVLDWLEFHLQAVWPDLKVKIADVTDQWAGIAIAGPKARDLLTGLVDIDIDNDAMPFLAVRDCQVLDVPGRLFRISFSGELGYELNVPADYGEAIWQASVTAAENLGGAIYGLEALDIMRIEKGHVTGAELDGRTTAVDCGLEWMLSSKKHFIGKGLMNRPELSHPDRKMLVGLKPVDGRSRLKGGAQIVARPKAQPPVEMLGHVTSAAFSPELDHPIALAMIKGGEKRLGEKLYMVHPMRGLEVEVEVTSPVFVDPEGERIHG